MIMLVQTHTIRHLENMNFVLLSKKHRLLLKKFDGKKIFIKSE